MGLPAAAATALLVQCLAVHGALIARLTLGMGAGPSPDSAPDDRLLDVVEAAARLGTSRDYLSMGGLRW
jgi:hypothetical protein